MSHCCHLRGRGFRITSDVSDETTGPLSQNAREEVCGFVCLFCSELTDPGKNEHHDKGPLLGDPILNSAFGIIVKFAGLFVSFFGIRFYAWRSGLRQLPLACTRRRRFQTHSLGGSRLPSGFVGFN